MTEEGPTTFLKLINTFHMPLELSKKDKKIAREIIEIGLQKEFQQGMEKMEAILTHWKTDKTDNRETYLKLYKSLTNFDKHIAKRYDDMKPSVYIFILAAQLSDGLISEEDLNKLDQVVRNAVLIISEG